jgi:hypothetical protein
MVRKRDPRDVNELAFAILKDLTRDRPPNPTPSPLRVFAGRKGGKKGGPERAKKLTSTERSAIARKAAIARWKRN